VCFISLYNCSSNKHLASDAYSNACRFPHSWKFILQFLSHMRTDNEAVTSTVFSDVKPCSLVGVYWHFGGTYLLHILGWRASQARSKQSKAHFRGLLFDPEDESSTSFETMVGIYQATQCHIPVDNTLNIHSGKTLKTTSWNYWTHFCNFCCECAKNDHMSGTATSYWHCNTFYINWQLFILFLCACH
jgi:hypothetical protein